MLPVLMTDARVFFKQTFATSNGSNGHQWLHRRVILAMDVGDRRVGLAISDDMQLTAIKAGVLNRQGAPLLTEESAKLLISLHQNNCVAGWLVGWPLPLQAGDSRAQLVKTNQFIHLLWLCYRETLKLSDTFPILCWDERCSSEAAKVALKHLGQKNPSGSDLDQKVASMLLQEYLDLCHRDAVE
jgi:RNase H-fold protein (predicted Holliday junction resolvase)